MCEQHWQAQRLFSCIAVGYLIFFSDDVAFFGLVIARATWCQWEHCNHVTVRKNADTWA